MKLGGSIGHTSRRLPPTTRDHGGSLSKLVYSRFIFLWTLRSLTAMELQALKIPSVMICDTMVGSLFQNRKIHGVGKYNVVCMFIFFVADLL